MFPSQAVGRLDQLSSCYKFFLVICRKQGLSKNKIALKTAALIIQLIDFAFIAVTLKNINL